MWKTLSFIKQVCRSLTLKPTSIHLTTNRAQVKLMVFYLLCNKNYNQFNMEEMFKVYLYKAILLNNNFSRDNHIKAIMLEFNIMRKLISCQTLTGSSFWDKITTSRKEATMFHLNNRIRPGITQILTKEPRSNYSRKKIIFKHYRKDLNIKMLRTKKETNSREQALASQWINYLPIVVKKTTKKKKS